MSLFDQSLNQFLDEAASKSPTPGGGSISAAAAASAAAMVSMVANLTANRKGYEDYWTQAQTVLAESSRLISELKNLTEDDIDAFQRLMGAWKTKSENESDFLQAVQVATQVPLRIARACVDILKQADRIAAFGNRNAVSDVGVAACLGFGALEGALLNVDINLPRIKEDKQREKFLSERTALLDEGKALKEKIMTAVSRRMGR